MSAQEIVTFDAGVPVFILARIMGTSLLMIDRAYGHLAPHALDVVRDALNNRSGHKPVQPCGFEGQVCDPEMWCKFLGRVF